MESLDLPEGVGSEIVATTRLETHVLTSGPKDRIPVFFVHGNATSSRFFAETLAALASRYRGLAPDLRGHGDSEAKPLDATRGSGTSPTICTISPCPSVSTISTWWDGPRAGAWPCNTRWTIPPR